MRGRVAAAAMVLLTSAATLFSQGQGGGFVAYPERRPGDLAAIERGRAPYGVNCVCCHGIDARGGDGGGPNLLRSSLVLEDVKGERIGSVLRAGRPGMPPFQFTDAQVADLAEFLHSFLVSSRTGPSKIDILTGDTEKGKASSSRSVRPVTRPQRSRRLPTSSTIQRCEWKHRFHTTANTGLGIGLLTTPVGLLFAGDVSGNFVAYDPVNGTPLWHTQLGANTTNAPETYTVDGRQYVLVAAGDAVYAFTLY